MSDDNHDCDEGPACCKSCGKLLVEHMGLQGTCAMLREANQRIDDLKNIVNSFYGNQLGNVKTYLRIVAKIHIEGGDEVDEDDKDSAWGKLTKAERDVANAIVLVVFEEYL